MPGLGLGGGGAGGGGSPGPAPDQPVVPDTVGILPKQAWVDNIEGMTAWGALDLSGQSLTFVDADLIEQSARKQFAIAGGAPSLQLHTNNLDTTNVESILNQVYNVASANGITGGSLTVGGPNMGLVTPFSPAIPHVDGSLILSLAAINPASIVAMYGPQDQKVTYSGGEGSFIMDGVTYTVSFNPGLDFWQSSSMSPNIEIGTQDSPSVGDIVNYVWATFNTPAITPPWPSNIALGPGDLSIILTGVAGEVYTSLTGDFVETQAGRSNSTIYTGSVTCNSFFFNIVLDPARNVGDSYYDFTGNIYIGMSSVVSASDPSDLLASLINSNFTAATRTGSTQVTMLFGNEVDYPITVGNWSDPGVVNLISATGATTGTAAAAEVWNAAITNLQALGWTGNFNDPVGGAYTAF